MKKLLALILMFTVVCSMWSLVIVSGDGTGGLVEIAQGKSAFANWHMASYFAMNATDGDEGTCFANYETSAIKLPTTFYVDLGASYALEQVHFQVKKPVAVAGINTDFIVSLSNQRPGAEQSDKVLIHTQVEEAEANQYVTLTLPPEVKAVPYRFIIFEKTAVTGLAISEVKAYTDPSSLTGDEDWWVEVGRNKGAVSTPSVAGYECWRATDDNLSTFWAGRGNDVRSIFILDLGAAYPLRAIEYLPRNGAEFGKEFKIYASNDNEFCVKDLVHEQGTVSLPLNAVSLIEVPSSLHANTYRYIMVDKTNITKDLGIAHIRAFAANSAATLPSKSVYSLKISQSKNVFSTSPASGTNGAFMVNGYYGGSSYVSTATTSWSWVFVDLGKPYPISYVTLALGINRQNKEYRRDYEIVATNDSGFASSNVVVLTKKDGYLAETAPANDSGLLLFHPADTYQDKEYRYVGVRKHLKDYGAGNKNSWLDINLLDVYTSMEGFTESIKPFTPTADNAKVTVNTNIVTMTGRSYQVIAACYDQNGDLVGVGTTEFSAPTVQGGVGNLIKTVTLNSIPGIDAAKYAKIMIWDFHQLRPAVPVSTINNINITPVGQ